MKTPLLASRILVGLLFIVSGWIKANDPLGFSYKLEEYFNVFHMGYLVPASLILSVMISVSEIVLGFAALSGTRMRTGAWLLLMLILFFTFLTFFSAYFNKVTDCGCFGDALHLRPWQSFSKDLILLLLILIIFSGRKKITPVFSPFPANAALLAVFLASSSYAIWCYRHLPPVDFRPYKAGTDILAKTKGTPDKLKYFYNLKNKKSGETKEFTSWPENWESEWDYVNYRTEITEKGIEPAIHDFSITDADGNDHTEEITGASGFSFLLVAYDLRQTNTESYTAANALSQICTKENIPFTALTASPAAETDRFRHEVQAMYDFYFCDATALKTMIRSNPGLILLKDGKVTKMWHYNDIPSFEKVKEKYFDKLK